MEQPSVTYSATQSVDYLGQTHKRTDTDVISSCKENMCEPYSDVCINDRTKLLENGILPFEFDNNVSLELELIVLYAMKTISKVSSVKFVTKTDQSDYVKIVDKGGYWSFVGRQGKGQELSVTKDLQNYPHPEGNIVHELMHALGFFHEHCHPDRDNYLTVIAKENDRDFGKVTMYTSEVGDGKKKCYGSGQRVKLSAYDINALNALYPSSSYLPTLRRRLKMKAKGRFIKRSVRRNWRKRIGRTGE
ncbi:unnamed protein product [Rhizophagus irregularis]|nr:unnamed protein product [Rhizophagus irregularis]